MGYDHTQHAPLYLFVVAAALASLVGAWSIPDPIGRLVCGAVTALLLVLGASFGYLRVRDEVEHLVIEYGPLPLFRRRVAYADVESVERGRSSLIDGWGIHWTPAGGWIWNLWGFDCVRLQLASGRSLRIGTDDPAGLEQFLLLRKQAGAGA